MARRRLLTILAGSAVFAAALAGPAAAVELGGGGDPVEGISQDAVTVAEEAVAEAVEATAAEPVAETTDAIAEVVGPEPSPTPSPSPSPTPDDDAAASTEDDSGDTLVAAGDVTPARSLAFLTGTGGTATARQARVDLPSPAPAAAPASTDEEVQAPQVAPAPTAIADAPVPSALAQVAGRAAREQGTPVMVLVAIASLLAAGFGTVRGARAAA